MDGVLEGERAIRGILTTDGGGELWSNVARVIVDEGATSGIRLNFMAGSTVVEGRILVNEKPAAGQTFGINIYSPDGSETLGLVTAESGADGAYRLEGLSARPMSLHAYISEGRSPIYTDPVRVYPRDASVETIDFHFTRGDSVVRGQVTRGGEAQHFGRIIIAGTVTQLDGDGRYELDGLSAEQTNFSPSLYAGSGKIYSSDTLRVRSGGTEELEFDFEFPSGTARLGGFVLDEKRAPVVARVVLNYRDDNGREWFHTANTRVDGYFSIDSVPETHGVAYVHVPGYESVPQSVTPVELLESEVVELSFEIRKGDED